MVVPLMTLLMAALAGCSSEDTPSTNEEEPSGTDARQVQIADGPPTVLVAEGALPWHQESTQGITWPYTLVTQTFVNPCVWNGSEVYFNNLKLRTGEHEIPIDTTRLEVLFEWGPADYVHDQLVLAYQPAGRDRPYESEYIENGKATVIDVKRSTKDGYWDVWACVSRDGDDSLTNPSAGPRLFAGTLTYKVVANP